MCPAPCKSGAQQISLEVRCILRPLGFLPTSRLCLRTGLRLIWWHSRRGTGSSWNEPFPKPSLDFGWHEDLQKVPVLLCSSSLLLDTGQLHATVSYHHGHGKEEGRGSKVWPTRPRSVQGAWTSTTSCWVSSRSDLASTYMSGNRMRQAVTKPSWSSACFLYFQSYCFSCEQIPCSSRCILSYKVENLQKWAFSPPEQSMISLFQ